MGLAIKRAYGFNFCSSWHISLSVMEESHKRITKEISTRQRTDTLSARVEAGGVPFIFFIFLFFFTNMLNIKHHFDFRFDLNQ